jgi:hypothetical protein
MKNNENDLTANIITLENLRERRFYVDLAQADAHWQETTASFRLEGLQATKEDAERVGRVIAGVWTLEQAIEDVRRVCLAGMVQ